MMRTRTIATGAGITGSARTVRRPLGSQARPGPLGLWHCAVSFPVAAPAIRLNHPHMQIATRAGRALAETGTCTGRLTSSSSMRDSFPFCRSAFEVGSITPGTKVIISARRF